MVEISQFDILVEFCSYEFVIFEVASFRETVSNLSRMLFILETYLNLAGKSSIFSF